MKNQLQKIDRQIEKLLQSMRAPSIDFKDKNSIRGHARKVLNKLKIPKKCEFCGFDQIVEVCHIIPISSFPKGVSLDLVNHPLNLVYLCPNHHAMLDKGIISLEQLKLSIPRLR
jgi:predicted restriction endonuclease